MRLLNNIGPIVDMSWEDLDDNMLDLVSVSDFSDEDDEMPDLILVSNSSEDSSDSKNNDNVDDRIGSSFDVLIEMVDEAIDCGIKLEIHTYSTAMLASKALASPNCKIELYESGASHHMFLYGNNFNNFIRVKSWTITTANGPEFIAMELGDMHLELPNKKSMLQILLKEVLYVMNMGADRKSVV